MSLMPKTLVIDDDTAAVRRLTDLLQERGVKLCVAVSGQDGFQKAVEKQPDVILLDIGITGINGFRICRLLKDDPRTRDIPVIFLAANDDPTHKRLGFEVGGSDYVTKPYDGSELMARLQVHAAVRRRLQNVPVAAAQTATEPAPTSRADRLLWQATETLRAEMADPPTLEILAKRLGTNARTLTNLFRQRFAMPAFAWLREERYRKACELLLASDIGIGEIAHRVGYANAAAFSTAFRERYGIAPREYRRLGGPKT